MKGTQVVLRSLCVSVLAMSLAACANAPQSTQASDQPKPEQPGILSSLLKSTRPVAVPAGTEIVIVLDQSISSAQANSGDPFDASVAEPVVIGGKTVIPKGAHVQGTVVEARASGRLKGVARLRLALSAVEIAGKSYDLQTTSLTRSGQNHDKRNWTLIGGGTGAGAAIGAIAGGGKGAAIGAAVGAGAGTATAAATGKKDIVLPAESQLSFKLSQPVSIEVKG
ncbi:MAG: hypothetical protein M1453_10445 [Acidobacteria bacterium]|nr:hypothetical protein [Acidobacteriota bacterium]MCL5288397.1 hypothetical protein [Acidobacteriota bacterium]